jgi:formylglycine-generating enzyme required for sulfatase activity
VEQVSWHEAVEFCRRLSQHSGKRYGLPSEAQWEYACRAGTTTPFHFGETLTAELANYDATYTYGDRPEGRRIGSRPPMWAASRPTPGACRTCTATCGSGARTTGMRITGCSKDGRPWLTSGQCLAEKGFRLLRGGSWFNAPGLPLGLPQLEPPGHRFPPQDSASLHLNYNSLHIGFRVCSAVRSPQDPFRPPLLRQQLRPLGRPPAVLRPWMLG